MNTRKFSLIILQFILFHFSLFSQDCNCNRWKKSYYISSGEQKFDYTHSCSQPSSSWEFVGYDDAYCKQLIENEKRRLLEEKKKNEALNILKNVKKTEGKDGYKVIAWWGEFLGNTGYWDEVGQPRCGIKPDSTFIVWNEDASVKFKGKIKNRSLEGLYRFKEGPFYDLKIIGEYLGIELTFLTPDFVYFNETNNYEHFISLKQKNKIKRNIPKDLYEYYIDDANILICEYYLFSNNKIFLFTKPLELENAIQIKENIIKNEIQNATNYFETLRDNLNKIIKKYDIIDTTYDKIINTHLSIFENSVIGKWNLFTNFEKSPSTSTEFKQLSETYNFNENHTFSYKAIINLYIDNNTSYKLDEINKQGVWFYENNKIILLPHKENIYNQDKQKIIKNDINLLISNINKALQDHNYLFSKSTYLVGDTALKQMILIADLLNFESKTSLYEQYKSTPFKEIYTELKNLDINLIETVKFELPKLFDKPKFKINNYFVQKTYYYYFDKGSRLSKEMIFSSIVGKKQKHNEYQTNKTSTVQKNRKIKRSIAKVGFVGGLVWLSLRTIEYISVK
jgi:hypothetical protein